MTFGILFLGFGLGLLFVIPPGPIAVTLVEVSVGQGRAAGARSGVGIAAGDMTAGAAAGLVVASGGVLPPSIFGWAQIVSAGALVVLGLAMVARPSAVESFAEAIQRPGRTFFLLTSLTPTVFGSWLAIIAALPFAGHLPSTAVFLLGAGGASAIYHVALGSAAGTFGHHVSGPVMLRVARVGGLAFAGLGLAMLFG